MCHVVNFPDWLALLRFLARFFILSQSGLFFVARTFFNRYGFNCGEECSVDRSSNEAAAPKALEAAVQENRIRLCVYMMITEMDTQKHLFCLYRQFYNTLSSEWGLN